MKPPFYRCSGCRYDFTVTAGTLFDGTHKPLRFWFEAIWYVTSQKSGGSALGLQRALGLGSYHSAWNWLHKLRRAMVRPGRERLSGVVEVDEVVVGGMTPGAQGRGRAGKSLVLVAAQVEGRKIGRIRLACITGYSRTCLVAAVPQLVTPGRVILTDGWQAYSALTDLGFIHRPTRSATTTPEKLLPAVHRVASLFKRWLLGTHHGSVAPAHLPYYLDEFTFRFNRRTSGNRGLLFQRLIQQSLACSPVPEKTLIGGKKSKQNHNR